MNADFKYPDDLDEALFKLREVADKDRAVALIAQYKQISSDQEIATRPTLKWLRLVYVSLAVVLIGVFQAGVISAHKELQHFYFPGVKITTVQHKDPKPKKNRSIGNRPLKIGEKEYTSGIGTNAANQLQVEIYSNKKYFLGSVGLDLYCEGKGSVQVSILHGTSRQALFKSGWISESHAFQFRIPVDSRILTLETKSSDKGGCENVNWVDLRMTD